MFVAAALAEPAKKESETKVTLDKKLDKRGLLDLGYGYGVHGLDVGYLGGGHGLHHDVHSFNTLNHYGHGNSLNHYNNFGHYGGHGEHVLDHHVDTVNTVTVVKGVPQPYPGMFVDDKVPIHSRTSNVDLRIFHFHFRYLVIKHVPVVHTKHVPVHVHVPQPYPVVKHVPVPVHVKEYVKGLYRPRLRSSIVQFDYF